MSPKSVLDFGLLPLLGSGLMLSIRYAWHLPTLPPKSSLYIDTDGMWPSDAASREAASRAYHAAYDSVYAIYAPHDLAQGMIVLFGCLLVLLPVLHCWRFSQLLRLRALPDRWLHLPFFILFCTGFGLALHSSIRESYDRGAYPPWADSIGIPLFFVAIAVILLLVFGGLLLWGLVQWMPRSPDTYLLNWNAKHWIDSLLWTAGAVYLLYEIGALIIVAVQDGSVLGVPTFLLGIYLVASVRASIIAALPDRKDGGAVGG